VSELRILLGVASGGSPAQPFLTSLKGLTLPKNVAPLKRSVAVGNYIPAQRELIMNDAIDEGFDYLFFVDDDMELPANALELLVQTAEADPATAVVGGLYYSRDSARPIVVADWTSTDTSYAHIPAFTSTSTGVVSGIGFGCALLRVSVARELGSPYFPAHVYIERSAHRARICDEDYLYCERVRNAGYVVRLDARVRCPHYDRASDTSAPIAWETDDVTSRPRMITSDNGTVQLVPLAADVPRIVEAHMRAELSYITVD
jgi:Glycosyl transferase family 2